MLMRVVAFQTAVRYSTDMTQQQLSQPDPVDPFRVMSSSETADLIGLSSRTVGRMSERGDFPRPLQLGGRRVGWRRGAVEHWILAREAESVAAAS